MSSRVATRPGVRRFVPPSPPKTPKSAGTRRRLMDVAAAMFIERGFDPVSMRDIAAAANVTKGAVYGHFRSKGQLLVEVIRWKLAEVDHSPGRADAIADPRRGVELLYEDAGRQTRLLEVDAAAVARHDPDVAAGLAALYQERHERIRDAMPEVSDPDTGAWLISVLSAGIGMKESAGVPLPDNERLRACLTTVIRSQF